MRLINESSSDDVPNKTSNRPDSEKRKARKEPFKFWDKFNQNIRIYSKEDISNYNWTEHILLQVIIFSWFSSYAYFIDVLLSYVHWAADNCDEEH